MNYPSLRVKKLYSDAKLPVRSTPVASGLDVFVHHFEQYVSGADGYPLTQELIRIGPNSRLLIATGLSVAIEPGYEVQVRPRSGNALKRGLTVLNAPGTVDADYRGPLNVILINLGDEIQEIKKGEKIAQIVVAPVCLSEVIEVEDLDKTVRGENGFGSTGI